MKKFNLESRKIRHLHTSAMIAVAVFAIFTFPRSAQATVLVNGGFETNTGSGQLGYNTTASGWSTTGFNFIFAPGTADTTGAFGVDGTLTLWGPNNGSANGLPATSPTGGYFLVADGDFQPDQGAGKQTAPVTQTLSGLTLGANYAVSFWWAAAQQEGFDGATQQYFTVAFGGSSQSTPTYNLPSHGFSGWMQQVFTFTADGTSDVLSFLPVGNVALPPFLLLDGVTVDETTPEPASVFLVLSGLTLMGGAMVFRHKRSARG